MALNEPLEARISELTQLAGALEGSHTILRKELELWLSQSLDKLIASDNQEERGRIKLLKQLLNWPIAVHEELKHLQSRD